MKVRGLKEFEVKPKILGTETNAFSDADESKLDGIEASATADQTDTEIETAYNNQVSVVSQAEAEAGTATTVRRWTAQRIKQAIAALGGGGGGFIAETGNFGLDGTYFTTSSSFASLIFNLLSPTASDLKTGATALKCVINAELATESTSVGEMELYNVTDSASVAGSTTAIPNASGYVTRKSAEFTLTQGKTYRIRIRRVSGQGQNGVNIRSAFLRFKPE